MDVFQEISDLFWSDYPVCVIRNFKEFIFSLHTTYLSDLEPTAGTAV